MAKEKTFQFVLTESECKLFRLLRDLETDFQTEYPLIYHDTHPKLDKPLTLSLGLDGRRIESSEVRVSHLIGDCASVCVQTVRRLLTAEESGAIVVERQADNVTPHESNDAVGAPGSASPAAPDQLTASNAIKDASWELVKQEVLPSYIKSVAFTVTSEDLNSERREELGTRFPGVSVVTETSSVEARFTADEGLKQNFNGTDAPASSTSITVSKPPELSTSIKAVAEVVPAAPTPKVATATPTIPTDPRSKPSLLSRITSDLTESRSVKVASPSSPLATKQCDKSPILRVATEIGLKTHVPGPVLHAMWLQWRNQIEVKPFSTVKGVKLVQYYENLVTLYILAYHKEEFDLCFVLLLRFQCTNYTFRNQFPHLAAAILAFQYLPEDNDFCRWIATLFAFLWPTQSWGKHQDIVDASPLIDKEALSKFLFAVAYIRDPHTKGHNTAVLAQWCAVHRHEEGDPEHGACRKAYALLEDDIDKIRREEAEHEFDEANQIVKDHVKNSRSHSTPVDTGHNTPGKFIKRKAESPTMSSHKKYKRGGGRGRGRGGLTG